MEITTLSEAMQLHAQIIKRGDAENNPALSKVFTFSALSVSGRLSYARSILDSLVTPNSYFWNVMLRGYSKSKNPNQALLLFTKMHDRGHFVRPDKFTFPFVLNSCGKLAAAHEGKQFHGLIYKAGLYGDRFIQNSLIHMYACCRELNYALQVFEEMVDRDVVSWTSIIDGCVNSNLTIKALKLFEEMQVEGIQPNDATVVLILRACADSGSISIGQKIHSFVNHNNLGEKNNVMTALVDMYAKCGRMENSLQMFNKMVEKDVFAWTAMISCFASHGRCEKALDFFHQMLEFNIKPDEMTMTAVLSACRNAGLVKEAYNYFNNMENKYGVRHTIQHFGCMVDLLSRTGRLSEAEEFINRMSIKPDAVVWRTMIWACMVHGDLERGERLLEFLKLDSDDCSNYVLLGNMYAFAGKWMDKARVRSLMVENQIEKSPGFSRIEVDGVLHEFAAGDWSHPRAEEIYRKLDEMGERLREKGYKPKVDEVLLDIGDEEKASQLKHHSEKLAVAFGLISMDPRSKILIVKNLRSCEDCHSFMKLISEIFDREIIVRDRIRFHYFSHGICSCGDYW